VHAAPLGNCYYATLAELAKSNVSFSSHDRSFDAGHPNTNLAGGFVGQAEAQYLHGGGKLRDAMLMLLRHEKKTSC
jgi:hypothetical protein